MLVGAVDELQKRKAVSTPIAHFHFIVCFQLFEGDFNSVDLAKDFQIPRGEVRLLFEGILVFTTDMGEAGRALGDFTFEPLGKAVLRVVLREDILGTIPPSTLLGRSLK